MSKFRAGWICACCALGVWSNSVPFLKVPLPEPAGMLAEPALKEASGLTQSGRVPGRFWSLNDSGHSAVLFAMDAEGHPEAAVRIRGAENQDWEAVESDPQGGLWIGDFGNNLNRRKDLRIYRVEEPGEEIPAELPVTRTLHFRYPDQEDFPPEIMNFDCEALFFRDGKLYLLTKHRSDRDTKLYRIEDLETEEIQTATLLGQYAWIGQVTDASLTPDGEKLAVLTYSGIWIFNRPADSDDFLRGEGMAWKFPNWSLKQVEGISWLDAQTLLICNEQRSLFRADLRSEVWKAFSGSDVRSGDESP